MTNAETGEQWLTVDEGWGRRAVDFATLLEPAACREYVAMHHHLNVAMDDRLLDIACGSGLSLELAAIRGAEVAGIDASSRLVAIARDRLPRADVQIGDMNDLPWPDASFDVVTSFRGLWATTTDALAEARRVLRPGGRIAVTTWGHVKVSPGFWALTPFALAPEDKVRAQAEMKSLGRPGVGEQILADAGFDDVRRHSVPFAWEFPDAETFARMIASTGPAFEAIQQIGADEFHRRCVEIATERLRVGLPLRAEIDCVGFTAVVAGVVRQEHLLGEPSEVDSAAQMAAEDVDLLGFVSNATKVWMHDAASHDLLFDAIAACAHGAGLSVAERGVAIIAAALVSGDTYCPLAWGEKLGQKTTPELAASVLLGSDDLLDERNRVIARWSRKVGRGAATTTDDIELLRSVGFGDPEIVRLTLFIALRVAFTKVNAALGATPEQAYVDLVDGSVRDAWLRVCGEVRNHADDSGR